MNRLPSSASFLDLVQSKSQCVGGRQVILDVDLAGLLEVSPASLRTCITRNRRRFSAEDLLTVPQSTGGTARWAFSDVGALIAMGQVRSPRAAEASVQIIREWGQKAGSVFGEELLEEETGGF